MYHRPVNDLDPQPERLPLRKEIPKGEAPTLILAVLAEKPAHGYAIAREIERVSNRALLLREGTLYPALRVLEGQGLISSAWEPSESGPDRKVYSLTPSGQAELENRKRDWDAFVGAMNALLGRKARNYA
jgi:PadR family transcriptional regulator PadR